MGQCACVRACVRACVCVCVCVCPCGLICLPSLLMSFSTTVDSERRCQVYFCTARPAVVLCHKLALCNISLLS